MRTRISWLARALGAAMLILALAGAVPGRALGAEPAGSADALDALRPGDLLQLDVYNHPDLTAVVRVPVSGPVHFPLIGPVDQVRGLTVDALSARLKTLYEANYLQQAVVVGDNGNANKDVVLLPNDLVVVPRLDRIYIAGQVMKPGALSIPSQETLTVSKAVSLAGGFDKYAREGEVQLLHAGEPVKAVNVEGILSGHREFEDPVLRPGDTVYVPQRRF